jgi:hypothetical protein
MLKVESYKLQPIVESILMKIVEDKTLWSQGKRLVGLGFSNAKTLRQLALPKCLDHTIHDNKP